MVHPARRVLLLAGRLGAHDDGWPVGAFLDRLAALGVSAQVLCLSGGDCPKDRGVECPALGQRWQRALALRRVGFGARLQRPELMHVLQASLGPVGLAMAEHWRLPYVLSIDEFLAPRARLRLSRRWCRGLAAASRELAGDLSRNLGVPGGFISVVPPGIAISEDAVPPRSSRVPVIGTAGPMVADSGFSVFLAAARRVLDAGLDAEFVIAGQGEDEVDLRRRADRLRITDRVTFTGHPVVGLRFWSVLDVFCQPAVAPTVGRPLAMALGWGVPSIATDVGGLRALIAHGMTGLRVPPDDPAALARAILDLLDDPERARGLGQRGRDLVRRDFHPEAEAENLVALYRAALDEGGGRSSRSLMTA